MNRQLRLNGLPPNGTTERQIARREAFDERDRVRLDITNIFDAPNDPHPITRAMLDAIEPAVVRVHRDLKAGVGDICDSGVPMIGWQTLPDRLDERALSRLVERAHGFRDSIDAYVSVGIGGSYLGIEATIGALCHQRFNQLSRDERNGAPEIYFLGQNMDPDYFRDTLDALRGKRVGINVISKSGTTTETALAFRILRRLLDESVGERLADAILITTDAQKGVLRQFAEAKRLSTFVVPDDIGGRFSVLSDVGLVGIAIAGIDLHAFVAGFRAMKTRTDAEDLGTNPAMMHAAVRILAWRCGKQIEVVATHSTALYQVARFMEQLFPESEGHGGQGLWVSPSQYSEKLHANGQMVQEGARNVIETFLRLEQFDSQVAIPADSGDLDGLNYLTDANRDLSFMNQLAIDGPAYAHFKGGVPNMTLSIPRRSAYCLGQLYFLLERSVAISGRMLGHNPFIQPGVIAYKNAIFALAGKPGSDALRREMDADSANRPRRVI